MKYSDFYDRKRGLEEFKILRNKLNEVLVNPRLGSFAELFAKIKKQAGAGDVVAQDVVAYFYRDGAERYLREDYIKYMHWEIVSAAGGNKFAIDKLQFFLGYAYDMIVNHRDFARIKNKNNIDEYNYIYIIGQQICEQLVEDLDINPEELSQTPDRFRPYAPEHFRDLRNAIDKALPTVIDEMKK